MPIPYERLREILNAKFPERTELRFGCEVRSFSRYNELGRSRSADRLTDERGGTFTIICSTTSGNGWLFVNSVGFGTLWEKEIYNSRREVGILGQPVTLAEVLRAMAPHSNFYITHYQGIPYARFTDLDDESEDQITVDIALPVSQWPDETLEKIIKLIE